LKNYDNDRQTEDKTEMMFLKTGCH